MRLVQNLCLVLLAAGLMFSAGSSAQSEYYRHVIFDNSGQSDIYWHSTASATAPN